MYWLPTGIQRGPAGKCQGFETQWSQPSGAWGTRALTSRGQFRLLLAGIIPDSWRVQRKVLYDQQPNGGAAADHRVLDRAAFMHACRAGGAAIEQALRDLDRSFFAILYRGAVQALRDPDAARDLVQDTFIKVWQRCATFRGDSELLPWIKVILRHGAIERLRRRRVEVPLENDQGMTSDALESVARLSLESGNSPEQAVQQRERAEVFRKGWARFKVDDPLHASVMTWIVEDGLSNEEITHLLERSPGATREFISQCRKRARHYLAEWYALSFEAGKT
jgi:RNA polymerase sigma factor (sigma-70 family)